jgi:TPR repeat protein
MYEGWDPRFEGDVALEGGGVELDFVAAAKYYSLCRFADSTYALARMYEEGRGVVQNFHEAERLLNIAAADDNVESKFRLACMYDEDGRMVGQNFVMAAQLCVCMHFSRIFFS